MSIRAVIRTTHAGKYILDCGVEEEFDIVSDAFERLDDLKPLLGVNGAESYPDPVRTVAHVATKRWSRVEFDAIAGATTQTEAVRLYRSMLPHFDRSDAGIVKQYQKLSRTHEPTGGATSDAIAILHTAKSEDEAVELLNSRFPGRFREENIRYKWNQIREALDLMEHTNTPGPATVSTTCGACGIQRPVESIDEHGMCSVCEEYANPQDERATEGAADRVSTGEEVTLHEEIHEEVHKIPEPSPTLEKPKKRKDAWLPEEDDVLREASTAEVAEIRHGKAFPEKRTKSAIRLRWYKLNPFNTRPEKIHTSSKPTLPERGARVRVITDIGRMPAGNTGKVIRRDERIGEVLVDLGPQNGCHWLKPEKVEVVA